MRKTLLFYLITILVLSINSKANSQEGIIIASPDNSMFNVNDYFGIDTSIYGDKVLIGASNDESEFGETGAAFVYKFNGTSWELEQKLTPKDRAGTFSGSFGWKVELFNNIAFISAPGHDSRKGAVYIFEFDGTEWSQSSRLMASNSLAYTRFGYRISSFENNRILISNRPDFGVSTIAAYIFEKENGSWVEKDILIPSKQVRYQSLEIALFNNIAVLGDIYYPNNGGVYTFNNSNGSWTESSILEGNGRAFGQSLAMSENLLAVGSIYNIYLYELVDNQWSPITTLEFPNNPGNFALGIDIDDDKLLAGSSVQQVTLFAKDGGSNWTKQKTFQPVVEDGLGGVGYGSRNISMHNNKVTIGATFWREGGNLANGGVFIYNLQNTLSVDDNQIVDNIKFYPNPVKDKLIIAKQHVGKVSGIEIYDINGKKLVSTNYFEEIDVSNLSKAIYIVKIKFLDGHVFSEKFVKE